MQDDFEKHKVDGVGLLSLTEADLHHKLHLKKVWRNFRSLKTSSNFRCICNCRSLSLSRGCPHNEYRAQAAKERSAMSRVSQSCWMRGRLQSTTRRRRLNASADSTEPLPYPQRTTWAVERVVKVESNNFGRSAGTPSRGDRQLVYTDFATPPITSRGIPAPSPPVCDTLRRTVPPCPG